MGPGAIPGAALAGEHVTDANFQQVVEASARVPVVFHLGAEVSPASRELAPLLEEALGEFAGRFLLAHVDVQASPAIAQAFQTASVPAVIAVLAGRPAPLFQGLATREQLRELFAQVLELARQAGVTGTTAGGAADQGGEGAGPEPEPLPPLHQEAFDAIERGDFEAAAAAYRKALRENPKDADARAGLAQVELMARAEGLDPQAALAAAQESPGDVDAQLAAADADMAAGRAGDAFARLIAAVRTAAGDDRERLRLRLVDLFEVVGGGDPHVVAARRELAAALF
jgi:putative thioredoxin